jgi:DNA-binding NtrC family response regulator
MTHERWLLDRAMALTEALMAERARARLVSLPPDGARLIEIERAALVAALERTNWNQAKAAALLSIPPRVMQFKVKKYRIHDDNPMMTCRAGLGGRKPGGRNVGRLPGKDWRVQPWQ